MSGFGPGPALIYHLRERLHANGADVTQYANDVRVQLSGPPRDVHALVRRLEGSLSSLSQWFDQNGMKINPHKNSVHSYRYSAKSPADPPDIHYLHGRED